MTNVEQQNDTIHKFEIAGLGKAPFKIVGFYKMPSPSLAGENPHAYNMQLQAMPTGHGCGSCTYCGTPLVNNYLIESSDGVKSSVGCDCVGKVGDRGLTTKIKEMQRIARREAREAKRQAEYEAKMQSQREANGGKTDAEIFQDKVDAREAAINEGKASIKVTLKPMITALKGAYGDFARDVSFLLNKVDFRSISPNMLRIATEIAAKQISGARKNSKAYNAEYERIEEIANEARKQYDALMEANPYPRR